MKKNLKQRLILIMTVISFISCSGDDFHDVDLRELEEHYYEFFITEGIFAERSFVGELKNDILLPLYYNYPNENKEKLSIDFNGANNFNTFINVIIEDNRTLSLGYSQSDLKNSFINIAFLDNGNYVLFRSQSGICEIENLEVYTTASANQTASYTLNFEGFFRQVNFSGNTEAAPTIKVSGKIIAKKSII